MSEQPEIAKLGQALRSQRKHLGLSQEDLARLADCGVVFLRQLEGGKATVRLSKVLDVLQALGLTLTLDRAAPGQHGALCIAIDSPHVAAVGADSPIPDSRHE